MFHELDFERWLYLNMQRLVGEERFSGKERSMSKRTKARESKRRGKKARRTQ